MGTGIILSIPMEAALKAILHFDFSRGFVRRRGALKIRRVDKAFKEIIIIIVFLKSLFMCLYVGGLYH